MVTPRQTPAPPNQLARELEAGLLSREEYQAAMAVHAGDLISEMEEQRRNPVAAFIESIRNRRAAAKLSAKHGEAEVREVLAALAEIPGYPPASLLWNAGHRHVPLYCFLRLKIAPLFRVVGMDVTRTGAWVDTEYQFGGAGVTRRAFAFERDWRGVLHLEGGRA